MIAGSPPEGPSDQRLMRPVDWVLATALMLAGLALRLHWASGIGLGDDFIFRGEVATILYNHQVLPDNQAYRFMWWLPVALSCRIFGLTEFGLIMPFTVIAVLGIGVVYALGLQLYGRAGAIIAALLLIVTPLDLAWSTMMTPDLLLSVLSGFTLLFVLRAFDLRDPLRRRRAWFFAAITMWLGYHAKIPGILMAPVVGMLCLVRRRELDRQFLTFVGTTIVLYGCTFLVSYVFWGDPLNALHQELKFQGLSGPQAVARRVYPDLFWYYPRLLFKDDHLGDLLYSIYPHLLVVFVVVAPFLRLRSSLVVAWWLFVFFMGMQFNFQRAEGVWIAGFRNIRHLHCLVYPTVLLLAGFIVALHARWPRVTNLLLVGVLLFSLREAANASWHPREAFGERRRVCYFLESLPKGSRIYADQGLQMWCSILDEMNGPPKVSALHSNVEGRVAQFRSIDDGYVVTGGANDPIYGCPPCLPRASELPPGRWKLVTEFPEPSVITEWRPERFRVWEAVPQDKR